MVPLVCDTLFVIPDRLTAAIPGGRQSQTSTSTRPVTLVPALALQPPAGHLRQGVLELASGFADHERHFLGAANQLEVRIQCFVQAIQGSDVFTITFKTAQPLLFWRVLFQPGVGLGDHQHATRVQTGVYLRQELARAVQAVDQVGGQDQVISGQEWFQVAGIALHKLHPVSRLGQPQ